MKKVMHCILVAIVVMGLLSYACPKIFAEELPESVKKQSRKDEVETEIWKKFDKSGPVKFLQVEDTAAASKKGTGAKLDGSIGERLIEIKVDPAIKGDKVVWSLENKGPSEVWVVAGGTEPVKIEAKAKTDLETPLVDGYCYIVVDNEGGKETQLSIKATCGETEAKTARGKSMTVIWF
jgi:hypothetical protein